MSRSTAASRVPAGDAERSFARGEDRNKLVFIGGFFIVGDLRKAVDAFGIAMEGDNKGHGRGGRIAVGDVDPIASFIAAGREF